MRKRLFHFAFPGWRIYLSVSLQDRFEALL